MRTFDIDARFLRPHVYSDGMYEFSNDMESATDLWAMIMAMSYRDGAHEVRFYFKRDTENLFYTAGEITYRLVDVDKRMRVLVVDALAAITGVRFPKKRKSVQIESSEFMVSLGERSTQVRVEYDPSSLSIILFLEVHRALATDARKLLDASKENEKGDEENEKGDGRGE